MGLPSLSLAKPDLLRRAHERHLCLCFNAASGGLFTVQIPRDSQVNLAPTLAQIDRLQHLVEFFPRYIFLILEGHCVGGALHLRHPRQPSRSLPRFVGFCLQQLAVLLWGRTMVMESLGNCPCLRL